MMKRHPNHIALGIGMIAIGLFLLINDHYFVWPPHYSDLLNYDIVGFLFFIDGIRIGGWVLWETQLAVTNAYMR